MPRRDKTGPVGAGPLTGCGMGPCLDTSVRCGAGFGPGCGRGLACRQGLGRGIRMEGTPAGHGMRRARMMRERAEARANYGK
ncbi:hypothetical protein SDC9_107631 [bioreactor metagenome]|uniref:Uncharacterized protein n=1 Tax=bioreactor metagenome TaxID=1076179 RepID=A0A645B5U9_9ZZZZ